MLSFTSFVASFPVHAVVRDSPAARHVYENIVWRDDIRVKMAAASDFGMAALVVCVKEIEDYYGSHGDGAELRRSEVRQTIGRMVAAALRPLRYEPSKTNKRKNFLKRESVSFKSAQVFEYVGGAGQRQRVESRIVDCKKGATRTLASAQEKK